jgi:hypothetical protein
MGFNQPFCCKHAVAFTFVLSDGQQKNEVLPDCENMVAALSVEEQWYPGMLEDA